MFHSFIVKHKSVIFTVPQKQTFNFAAKIFIASFLIACATSQLRAQKIISENERIRALQVQDTVTFEERLVALALESPQYEGSKHQNNINELVLKKAKNSWMNLLTVSTNYNDQSFAKTNTPGTYVYPKYFFGLNIPLGIIFSQRGEIKAAREVIELSKNNQKQLARNIRADILSKYKQYKTYGDLILLQNEVINDEQAVLLQTEQKFRDGKTSIELFNAAQKSYNSEIAKRLQLQLQQDLLKIEIEKIIGTKLEYVNY